MACRTGSVKRGAGNMDKAIKSLDELQKTMEGKKAVNEAKFLKQVNTSLASANITDARLITENAEIKAEYAYEFSLDKIVKVVTSALDVAKNLVAASGTGVTVAQAAMSKGAIDSYTGLVTSVAEAAKSTSQGAASLSYSMNRISPGIYAFLYASSKNITDVDTFGKEAVSITAIYYKLYQSIDDFKQQAEFDGAIIDKQSYLKMKTVQAALVDELANGSITVDDWMKRDTALSAAVAQAKKRFEANSFKSRDKTMAAKSESLNSSSDQKLVQNSINKLATLGATHKAALETSQKRLAEAYF